MSSIHNQTRKRTQSKADDTDAAYERLRQNALWRAKKVRFKNDSLLLLGEPGFLPTPLSSNQQPNELFPDAFSGSYQVPIIQSINADPSSMMGYSWDNNRRQDNPSLIVNPSYCGAPGEHHTLSGIYGMTSTNPSDLQKTMMFQGVFPDTFKSADFLSGSASQTSPDSQGNPPQSMSADFLIKNRDDIPTWITDNISVEQWHTIRNSTHSNSSHRVIPSKWGIPSSYQGRDIVVYLSTSLRHELRRSTPPNMPSETIRGRVESIIQKNDKIGSRLMKDVNFLSSVIGSLDALLPDGEDRRTFKITLPNQQEEITYQTINANLKSVKKNYIFMLYFYKKFPKNTPEQHAINSILHYLAFEHLPDGQTMSLTLKELFGSLRFIYKIALHKNPSLGSNVPPLSSTDSDPSAGIQTIVTKPEQQVGISTPNPPYVDDRNQTPEYCSTINSMNVDNARILLEKKLDAINNKNKKYAQNLAFVFDDKHTFLNNYRSFRNAYQNPLMVPRNIIVTQNTLEHFSETLQNFSETDIQSDDTNGEKAVLFYLQQCHGKNKTKPETLINSLFRAFADLAVFMERQAA